MSDDRYKLIFSGVVKGTEPESAKAAIQERFQIQLSTIEKWFGKEKATVKQNLTEDQAWTLQYVLETLGVEVSVVLQSRSNLQLQGLSMAPQTSSQSNEPAFQFRSYQPNGIVEFDAKPVSGQRASSQTISRRRASNNKQVAETKSFKLTHMVAAAILVMAVSYVGKQFFTGAEGMQQPIAAWSE